MLKFLVVDAPSSYNIIMGRPSLNSFRAVASTYHMKLKFPAYRGIGEEKGDRRIARECHANTLKKKSHPPMERRTQIPSQEKKRLEESRDHSLPPLEQHEQQMRKRRIEEEKLAAAEKLKDVQVVEGESEKTTLIGTAMGPRTEEELVQFLRVNSDVFAWTVHDLEGINPEVMTHKLNVNPTFQPIRQKKRNFGIERNDIIRKEVEKLLAAGHICLVQYPEWLANVVLVPKPNKKWRMCIDFTDLNRACLKDSYPLPRIDALVDSTARCEMMSFGRFSRI
ncbi:UNVERIFIED_CONTAM: Transposon Ty3-G Gag-Pol polyprotein [Sesamum latifolium]|uniref:Transposon Ty3-G Gag-Pol polyprotein n=1 Tax=Sesamum latifolium TaxID=2727402 RepID=A0AAW2SI93_9LAMI